ncbi:MAG: hypothetical protein ABH954_00165 [Candidatus Omnitrophota bacterium]
MIFDCPGAKDFKRPKPEDIKCPHCGEEIEIWTDEVKAICPKCKKEVTRKQLPSCLDWCKYAKECVGDELYNKYLKNKKQNTDNH